MVQTKKRLNNVKTYFSKPQNIILLLFGILLSFTTIAPIVAIVKDTFAIHPGTIDAYLTGKTTGFSIVNYVDLLKREKLENENANNYIRIIDEKAHRLKLLTEDLVEVSKISSGNIKLDVQTIDFLELLYQTGGEFNERFEARNLTIITKLPGVPVLINADGRQLYRTIENLYTNAAKYAQENTNIYVELLPLDEIVVFTIKNIAKPELQIAAGNYEELTERFVRGEASRTTEGSGLGLSIAKSLTVLMGGTFHIQVDGETFTARITFPLANGN